MQLSCSLREICHLIHITAESAHELQLESQQKCVCVCGCCCNRRHEHFVFVRKYQYQWTEHTATHEMLNSKYLASHWNRRQHQHHTPFAPQETGSHDGDICAGNKRNEEASAVVEPQQRSKCQQASL